LGILHLALDDLDEEESSATELKPFDLVPIIVLRILKIIL
jgi:hypothetical protein